LSDTDHWLEKIFGSRGSRQLIRVMLDSPRLEWTKAELLAELDMSPSSGYRALHRLVEADVINMQESIIQWASTAISTALQKFAATIQSGQDDHPAERPTTSVDGLIAVVHKLLEIQEHLIQTDPQVRPTPPGQLSEVVVTPDMFPDDKPKSITPEIRQMITAQQGQWAAAWPAVLENLGLPPKAPAKVLEQTCPVCDGTLIEQRLCPICMRLHGPDIEVCDTCDDPVVVGMRCNHCKLLHHGSVQIDMEGFDLL